MAETGSPMPAAALSQPAVEELRRRRHPEPVPTNRSGLPPGSPCDWLGRNYCDILANFGKLDRLAPRGRFDGRVDDGEALEIVGPRAFRGRPSR
jgi:hypothetical protein